MFFFSITNLEWVSNKFLIFQLKMGYSYDFTIKLFSSGILTE